MKNTDHFLNRYNKHIQTTGFGVPGQTALAHSKILVVGAGELASPVISYLSSMGIGTIGIASTEIIALEDLPATPLYFSNQVGKLKAESASRQIKEINPEVNVIVHEKALSSGNIISVISNYDVVVDTGNQNKQSLLINDACVITGKPMVFGALFASSGYISVFNYKKNATYRCLVQLKDIWQLLKEEKKQGLSTFAGITGCWMANETIKIVGEIGDVASNKLLIFNYMSNQLKSVNIAAIPENLEIKSLYQFNEPELSTETEADPILSINSKMLTLKIKYKEALQLIDIRNIPNHGNKDDKTILSLPNRQIFNQLHLVHQDIPVILLSEDGVSAKKVAVELNKAHGFGNIYYLENGTEAWNME
ncbi:HesA/MoeB/ThiF family protein [Arcticibacter eurypsychrophilus]|uniref:HesA/MoeB/ThiF family protein n=1 Tax=Arcticibacter eurypsychrophilus TaxID=1434752 RepID=UPI00084DF07F|nr:HesA/MoeB/ThiF family protein [Arcticibacter eurypsychrophilus]